MNLYLVKGQWWCGLIYCNETSLTTLVRYSIGDLDHPFEAEVLGDENDFGMLGEYFKEHCSQENYEKFSRFVSRLTEDKEHAE